MVALRRGEECDGLGRRAYSEFVDRSGGKSLEQGAGACGVARADEQLQLRATDLFGQWHARREIIQCSERLPVADTQRCFGGLGCELLLDAGSLCLAPMRQVGSEVAGIAKQVAAIVKYQSCKFGA